MYRLKNFEGEKLPPTPATFFPHMMRVNFVSKRDKSYVQCHPNLPPLNLSGWETHDETFIPVKCLIGPAPKEVMELVKCTCGKGCKEGKCSCVSNGLNCTPLCKCYSNGCSHFSTKTVEQSHGEDEDGNEDEEDLLFCA